MFGSITTAKSYVNARKDTLCTEPLGTHGGRDLLVEAGREQSGGVGEHFTFNGIGFWGRR